MLESVFDSMRNEVEQRIKAYMEFNKISKEDLEENGKRILYADHPLEEYFFYKDDLICRTQIIIK